MTQIPDPSTLSGTFPLNLEPQISSLDSGLMDARSGSAMPPPPSTHSSAHPSSRFPTTQPINAAQSVTEAIIHLQGVHKTYDNGSHALANVDLSVPRGDFVFITGPSGSGKSTLLKLLYGEERPTAGNIMVDGHAPNQLRGNKLSLLRRRIGIVFQDYKLIPRRTIAENISLALWVQGYTRHEIQRRLDSALKIVGLPHKAHQFPEELSGGEQQRASIARAIVGTPPILLADEPTGNLDSENSRQVIRLLEKLNQVGITVLVTTHDEALLQSSDHRIVHLQDGSLQPRERA